MQEETSRAFIIGAHGFKALGVAPALYIVATPIGNLKDITIRALETLAGVDVIACEDTRVSRVLLAHYGIKNRLIAFHEYSDTKTADYIIEMLADGKSVALISDAGTPLISDPGFLLVNRARQQGINVVPIPGASAFTTALVAAGLPTDGFMFCGFLPTKKAARLEKLKQYRQLGATLIFYESPHRLLDSLQDMAAQLGQERKVAIARELTKKFETIDTGTFASLHAKYSQVQRIKGEIVIIIEPFRENPVINEDDLDKLLWQTAQTLSLSKAAHEVATLTGLKKNALYQRLLALKNSHK